MEPDTGTSGQLSGAVDTARQKTEEQAGQIVESGRSALRDQIDQRSTQAGQQAQSLASSLRDTATQMRMEGDPQKQRIAGVAESGAERLDRAGQYLNDRAAPGNLLHFLQLTWQRLTSARGAAPETIGLDDLLLTLSQLSGLPLSILDERQGLDLDGLRDFFNQRVIGQREAVECLVERVAMIKAGVSSPMMRRSPDSICGRIMSSTPDGLLRCVPAQRSS